MASLAVFSMIALSCSLPALITANEFLRTAPHELTDRISEDEVRASLVNEIEISLPGALGSTRFSNIEATIKPIYESLPKNAYGNLEHAVARYALHRSFVLRHGWVIKGLAPDSGKYHSSSPVGVLKGQVPSLVENMFEQRVSKQGFKVHDVALLAATIEHLIQEEAVHRLRAAFKIHEEEFTGDLDDTSVSEMLDTYMAAFILSSNLTEMSLADARKMNAELPEVFMFWNQTREFAYGIQKNVSNAYKNTDPLASPTDSVALAKVAQSVAEEFGSFFHQTVCKSMKSNLMNLEYQDTGRVKVSDFYKPALDGFWQFQESVGYLRELGVLEQTDPKEPRVMIANYLVSPSNCVTMSGFYSVCCKNECEDLLGHLEQKIVSPEAAPETIAALVANLPSSTSSAPRNISATVLTRLHEIAANHGGKVPLHGRLFAQWMHQVFPRECPFPHVSGTTSPAFPEEWMEATGSETIATEEEMKQYIQWSSNVVVNDVAVEDLMAWSSEEELLCVQPVGGAHMSLDTKSRGPAAQRSMVLLAVAGSLAYGLIQTMKDAVFPYNYGLRVEPQKFVI